MIPRETLFIGVIIRSAFQWRHLLCLQDLIPGALRTQEDEDQVGDLVHGGRRTQVK